MSEDRFIEIFRKLMSLPTKTSIDAAYIAGFADAMFQIRREAKFKGRIGDMEWHEWLNYWENRISEMAKLSEKAKL